MALISTIIPTYNRTAELRRAIASVQAQTFTDWECLVVGDGTEPETVALMDELTAHDDRFRFWNLPHADYPADPHLRWMIAGTIAFNFGLDQATGEFVAYLADDDEYLPIHHRVLLNEARRSGAAVVYGQSRAERNIYGHFPPDRYATTQGAYIIRRDIAGRARTDCTDVAWDAHWWNDLLERRVSFAFVDEIVHRYHPAPATRAFHGS